MNNQKINISVLTFLLLFLSFTVSTSAQSPDQFFDRADTFFRTNIQNGKVPYKTIQQSPAQLKELVKQIGNISLEGARPAEKKAFYIDAYNILTINSIIEHDIPSSPMDVDGFFDTIKHNIAGKQLTLNDIEKKRLLPVYNDPRIHFSVVCGAVSCPPIRPFAYRPEKLDKQLSLVTRKTLNSDFIKVNRSKKTARISQIFKWYKQDFLKKSDSVLDFINQYRNKKIPDDYAIDHYKYNWSLNIQQ